MADQVNGGFYNAQTSRGVDDSMYVDRNAMMVGSVHSRRCAVRRHLAPRFRAEVAGDDRRSDVHAW